MPNIAYISFNHITNNRESNHEDNRTVTVQIKT